MSSTSLYRVMLVDEDPRVLDGLRRQLRAQRERWRIEYVRTGAEAIASLEKEAADVVVSDAPPREGSGVDFLRTVQKRWPATVRIVLSGRASRSEFVADVGVAHQRLHKPCDTMNLIRAIERAHELASLLEDAELRAIACSIDALPIAAGVYSQLEQAIEDEKCGVSELAAIVERDIGLTTKLLQLVNSAFFGLSRRITNVRDAITLIGSETLHTLAMTSMAFNTLTQDHTDGGSIERLWESSCEVGRIAGRIAESCGAGPEAVERARLAGALSLVGRGVLIREFPQRFAEAQDKARMLQLRLHEAEAVVFGAGQQLIGAYALGVWGFDDDLISTVMFQATPELCDAAHAEHPVTFVHLARSCLAPSALVEQLAPADAALDRAGLTADALTRLEIAA